MNNINYKDIIFPEKISEYKEQHRIFYNTLNSMIYDVSFLNACVDIQDRELNSDWITIKMLHRNVFENLITKTYRCFFDNSGNDATNIFKFKNSVLSKYLKNEYRKEIKFKIQQLPIQSSEYKTKMRALCNNCSALRNGFIGHRLLNTLDDSEINLNDIKQLLEFGCELLQTLSFEPRDFYTFVEGDGYNFSREFEFTDICSRKFVLNSFLTSKYITSIECKIDSLCPVSIKNRIENIIKEINDGK